MEIRMFRRIHFLIGLFLLVFILSSCSKPEAPKTILIGTVTDQTGPLTAFGIECKYAFQLFEKEVNKDGGIFVKKYNRKIPVEIRSAELGNSGPENSYTSQKMAHRI